ncbi:villin-4-like protein [Tanacetum coccineum]
MELYPGEDQEECLIGTWFGSLSIKEDIISATSQTYKMVESQKFLAALSRVYEGSGLPFSSPSSKALWFLRVVSMMDIRILYKRRSFLMELARRKKQHYASNLT